MRSRSNITEKTLNASESYTKRNEEEIRKYFIFQIQLQLKTLIPWKGFQRLNQTNTGLCWRSFRIFSICTKNRKLQSSSPWQHSRLDCNIFTWEITRDAVTSYEVRKGLIVNNWYKLFLPWQLWGILEKYNENCLTFVKTDHLCTTLHGKSKVILDPNLFNRHLSNYKSYVKIILNCKLHVCISCCFNSFNHR